MGREHISIELQRDEDAKGRQWAETKRKETGRRKEGKGRKAEEKWKRTHEGS